MKNKFHPFHMVSLSPWPIINSFMAWNMVLSLTSYFNSSKSLLTITTIMILYLTSFMWWKDIIRESMMEGMHQLNVANGLKMGMILFIASEVFFFISFFWAYFHSSISPTIEIGMNWPPVSIMSFNPMHVPLLNTLILISSGVSVTWSHHCIIKSDKKNSMMSLSLTCALGLIFSALQAMEYIQSTFTVSDSTYGSTFFLATGFHGLHVIIGTTFLLVCLKRLNNKSVSKWHLIGFEMAAWYWHFVDIVWLFLYISIYWWGK